MSRILVKELLGEDIRSRANANKIKTEITNIASPIIIDMQGVIFVSRSFSDELLSIADAISAKIVNTDGEVKTMIDIVRRSRSMHKERVAITDNVIELNDMNSVHDYFSSIR